jgi:hypothetical protein
MGKTIPNTDIVEVAIIAAALEISGSGHFEGTEDLTEVRLERFKKAYKAIVETVRNNSIKPPRHPLEARD